MTPNHLYPTHTFMEPRERRDRTKGPLAWRHQRKVVREFQKLVDGGEGGPTEAEQTLARNEFDPPTIDSGVSGETLGDRESMKRGQELVFISVNNSLNEHRDTTEYWRCKTTFESESLRRTRTTM